jgi:hypothetical protein
MSVFSCVVFLSQNTIWEECNKSVVDFTNKWHLKKSLNSILHSQNGDEDILSGNTSLYLFKTKYYLFKISNRFYH